MRIQISGFKALIFVLIIFALLITLFIIAIKLFIFLLPVIIILYLISLFFRKKSFKTNYYQNSKNKKNISEKEIDVEYKVKN